jgi:hypothetical protein
MLVHVSDVSDSGTHFRTPLTTTPELDVNKIAPGWIRIPLIKTADSALIVTAWFTITLVLTVMSAHASIRILTSGTRIAATDIALSSLAANEAMAYRTAEMLVADELAAVKAPMAYRTAETLTDDAAATAAAAKVTRCAATETEDDAETLNEALRTAVAETDAADEAAIDTAVVT